MSPADEYEIHITLSPDGTVSTGAYCLWTDYWNDYLAFLGEAKQAGEANHRNANRYLRAANMCLFAHLEGVVGHLQDCIKLSNKQKRMPLCERMSIIETEARKHGACSGLDLQLDKYVRDVITHPDIQKTYPPKTSEDHAGADSLTVDTGFVFYYLSDKKVESLGNQISSWLDSVCSALKVRRFTDTERLLNEEGKPFSDLFGPTERREV